jgi:hypothetical protein
MLLPLLGSVAAGHRTIRCYNKLANIILNNFKSRSGNPEEREILRRRRRSLSRELENPPSLSLSLSLSLFFLRAIKLYPFSSTKFDPLFCRHHPKKRGGTKNNPRQKCKNWVITRLSQIPHKGSNRNSGKKNKKLSGACYCTHLTSNICSDFPGN